jgi:hypothetical protein
MPVALDVGAADWVLGISAARVVAVEEWTHTLRSLESSVWHNRTQVEDMATADKAFEILRDALQVYPEMEGRNGIAPEPSEQWRFFRTLEWAEAAGPAAAPIADCVVELLKIWDHRVKESAIAAISAIGEPATAHLNALVDREKGNLVVLNAVREARDGIVSSRLGHGKAEETMQESREELEAVVGSLIEDLRGYWSTKQLAAARALERIGEKGVKAVADLKGILFQDVGDNLSYGPEHEELQRAAASALGAMAQAEQARAALIQTLVGGECPACCYAAKALRRAGPSVLDDCIRIWDAGTDRHRWHVAIVFAGLGEQAGVVTERLVAALASRTEALVCAVLESLASVSPTRGFQASFERLEAESHVVRICAAIIVLELGNRSR